MPSLTIPQAFEHAVQLHRAGDLTQAESIYRQILRLDPRHSAAVHLLGVIAHQTGHQRQAAELIELAIRLKADDAEYHNNLGEVYRTQERFDDALVAYRAAIRLQPAYAAAHNNLGVVLLERGDLDAADRAFREALRLRPDYATAQLNLGMVFEQRGDIPRAVEAYEAALRLQPRLAAAHVNLGNIRVHYGLPEEAAASYERALALEPNRSDALTGLGNAAKDLGELDTALGLYQRALAAKPDNHVAHSNLVYGQLFHAQFDDAQIAAELRRWQEAHAAPLRRPSVNFANPRDPERRLRIGYVSPNFSGHVVGWNLLPLFQHHDRRQCELFCYSDTVPEDATSQKFRELADHWCHTARWPAEKLARRIEADGIDILVDLTLHMSGHRLLVFARQPAPVQVTFAGYPGSTGLNSITYRLTDARLDPPELPQPYVEEPVRLPSFWCYAPRGDEPEPGPPPMLAQGHVTFGCLNNFCKVTPRTLSLWARVLRAVPTAKLLLLAANGRHRARTLARLQEEGIAAERIEFTDRAAHARYLATYQRIDVALDTFPYNGHTTSCDALWMGVPVVTLAGRTIVGRAGASQLGNLGLAELVATTEAEFVQLAVSLAHDPARLAELRASLRTRMRNSPLMDAPGFAAAIEAAYRRMWRTWCADTAAAATT